MCVRLVVFKNIEIFRCYNYGDNLVYTENLHTKLVLNFIHILRNIQISHEYDSSFVCLISYANEHPSVWSPTRLHICKVIIFLRKYVLCFSLAVQVIRKIFMVALISGRIDLEESCCGISVAMLHAQTINLSWNGFMP